MGKVRDSEFTIMIIGLRLCTLTLLCDVPLDPTPYLNRRDSRSEIWEK